jgi:hypothetical protein
MALVVKDRVKETTTTTGAGTITLAGASTGFQSFSVIGNGNTTYYTIAGQTGTEWEVGIGTYNSSGTTLTRNTVLASSNSGLFVIFSAGTKDVFVTYPADYAAFATNTVSSFSGGSTGLTPNTATTGAVSLAGTLAVANGGTGVTTSTGTGAVVLGTSLTLTTPALGTPSAIVLTNATGLGYAAMPAGSILQVVYAAKTTSFVGTSVQTGTGYYIDVTGMTATITPKSISSRIMVVVNMYIGFTTTGGGYNQSMRVKRNGTYPILGTAEGGRPTSSGRINMYGLTTYSMQQFNGFYVDSPASTSALVYQIELGGYSGSPVVYVNRSETWQVLANDYDNVPVSTLTLMEVAG